MRKTIAFIAILCMGFLAFGQDSSSGGGTGFGFQAGVSLGTDIITGSDGNPETWNSLGFKPDLSIGPFGVGFDFTFRFKLMPPDTDAALEIYPGDWIPDADAGKGILDLYLPKIMYVRYGQRGDPLFVKLGSIDDLTLGNGFLVGNYSNTRFLPELRIFGLNVGLDGQLFNFPFVGVEALTGNLARFDVFGTRLFVRPLITTSIPILKDMQVGATIAMDRDPGTYFKPDPDLPIPEFDPVAIGGADIFVPIIKSQLFPLAAFMEMGFQPLGRTGFMLGAGGRLLGFITYGAQLRILGAGFIPVYFDANYDLYRASKAQFMATDPTGDRFAGWLAKAGTSLFDDKIYFEVSVDGPFHTAEAGSTFQADYPHLRGVAGLREGLLGGIFFDFVYEKYMLGSEANSFFEDLVDPNNAVITAAVNYRSGAAIFTLLYNLRYNPAAPKGFDVTSSLVTTIKF
jgi:hypothetical protein